MKDSNDLVSLVTRTTPGTTVPVKVMRDRKPMTLNVKVDELDLAQEERGAPRARSRRTAVPNRRTPGSA